MQWGVCFLNDYPYYPRKLFRLTTIGVQNLKNKHNEIKIGKVLQKEVYSVVHQARRSAGRMEPNRRH